MLPQQHPAGSLHDNRDSRQVGKNITVLFQQLYKFTHTHM